MCPTFSCWESSCLELPDCLDFSICHNSLTCQVWNQNYSLFILWDLSLVASSFHSGFFSLVLLSDVPCVLWFFDYGKEEENCGQRAWKRGSSEKSELQSCLCFGAVLDRFFHPLLLSNCKEKGFVKSWLIWS